MDRKFLNDFLKNLNTTFEEKKEEKKRKNVLIMDGMNLFLRCFSTVTTISPSGQHVGGLLGSLYSLGFTVKNLNPDEVILVFDGDNSHYSRKNIFPDYKSNRVKRRIANFEFFDTLEDEKESKQAQLFRLIDYLHCLPIKMIVIDNYEADDIISYLSDYYSKTLNHSVTICSTDKDYYQLIDDDINIYNPNKKEIMNESKVYDKYQIYPHNFLYFRMITGDTSDNIPNVNGFQIKTLLKYFPFFSNRDNISLEQILEYSKENIDEKKKYSDILINEHQLKINQKLMDLKNIYFQDVDKLLIHQSLDLQIKLKSLEFYKLICEDKLLELFPNPMDWARDNFITLTNK